MAKTHTITEGLASPPTYVDWKTGALTGEAIQRSAKQLGQMQGLFEDRESWTRMDPATSVYEVQYWSPVADGTVGGLFWGNSTVFPGRVGSEYFMTKGHFHSQVNRGEYYATVSGEGLLILMDQERRSTTQPMSPGTVHYVRGAIAHRVVNTGSAPLRFLACWPSDAGHDYATIEEQGFSLRVIERDGRPTLVPCP